MGNYLKQSEEGKNLSEIKEIESKENESKPIEKLGEIPQKDNRNDVSLQNINENRNIYIYFNLAYQKSKKYKIYLSKEYKGFDNLEKIEEKELVKLNDSLNLQIYKFQIIPELENENNNKTKFEFVVYVEEENSDKHQYIIKIKDLKKDFYEYNFKIEKINILPLKYEQQFINYSQLLKNKYKIKQGTKEHDDFILSTQNLLIGNNIKFDFSFYLSIFLEGFKSNYVYRHLIIFKPDKISGLGELSESNIKIMKNILNVIAKDPSNIHVEENSKEKSKEKFYCIYLYFNLNYQKEEVIKMFDDENKFKYLINNLIIYHKFFEDLLLPKECVIKLIEKANEYNKIANLLFYLGKDCVQFLQVIIEEHELISKCLKDNTDIESKNKLCFIDIEKYVEPKREDDIILILECFKKIKKNKIKFIKFSSSLLEKYFEIYEEINPLNLLLLKQIILIIKEIDNKFEFELENIDSKIHNESLLKEINDFELLYFCYNIAQEKEQKITCLIKMQEKYKEIISNFTFENNDTFINQTAYLIHFSDKNQANIDKFLIEVIQKKFDIKTVNEIYIKLTQKFDLSIECQNIIIDYFTKNKQNSNNLIYLILKCDKIRNNILSNFDNFIIREEDFFSEDDTENYKFFKELVENGIFIKDEIKESKYIKEAKNIIFPLQEKLKKLDISLENLNSFFNEEKNFVNDRFRNRFLYIFLLDEKEAQTSFDNLKIKMNEIKKNIKDLEIVLSYFSHFLNNHHSKEIEKLKKIISDMKKQPLKIDYTNEIREFAKNFEKIPEYKLRLESVFFNIIYIDEIKKKNNDEKAMCKTKSEIKNLKRFFFVGKKDKKMLELCLKAFKEPDINKMKKELDLLSKLLKIKEKYNEKKNDLINDILLLIKKNLLNISEAIKNFIEKMNIKDNDFMKEITNIINNLKEKNDTDIIKLCKQKLKDLNIDIDEKESNYIDLLISFNEQPESIEFLLKITPEECQNLKETILENNYSYISFNDIFNMEKCIEYFKYIQGNKSNAKDIIVSLKNKLKEKHNILNIFKNFIPKYNQIKKLQTSLHKSEVLKYKMQKIFNGSTFILSNNMKSPIECIFDGKEESKSKGVFSKDNLISLRERAQLSKNLSPDFNLFIEIITEIINISNILEKIYDKGYPKDIIVNIKIKVNVIKEENKEVKLDSKISYYIDNEKLQKDYKELVFQLMKILSFLESKQIDSYKEKPLIRYLYGRQFKLLNDYFKSDDVINQNEKKVNSLLKYITNDLFKKNIKNGNTERKGNVIENNIKECDIYLNNIIAENGLTLDKIYKNTIIKQELKKYKYKGIYIYLCKKLEKDLFQIYKYLTGNNPIAQNILLCNKITTNEQITSFLYRAILCEYNSCFIIGGIELLNNDKKTYLIELLNSFFQKGDENMNSCLIFLYSTKYSDIYKILDSLKYKKIFTLKRDLFINERYEGNDIEIIRSDISGIGKSTQIELEINKNKHEDFPLGGVLTYETILKRLKELQSNIHFLHLDLYNTDQVTLMNEFLFSILIIRFYGQNENMFYLSKDIQIKVEIPNTYIDFFEKFPILTLFRTKVFKITNLPPLIVPKELDSNIQLVANYLRALKENKINDKDLIFPNITPNDFKERYYFVKKVKYSTSVNAELISDSDCQKLIFDIIKLSLEQPTYYQIISFINMLAAQLKKLNQNFFLNAHQLIINQSQNAFRTFIVKNFIEVSKHFSEGAFTKIIKQKQNHSVNKSLFGIYNEGEFMNSDINSLANNQHKVISFDNIDFSLIFFHEGSSQLLSIITNKNKLDQEYQDLLLIKNSQSVKEKDKIKELPNYKTYTQKQFLEELKNILDINNPIERGKGSDKISLEEIVGNYVFTADNFLKIVLILLRIRANIPVIMMGETGCGKTSLIRKLSELKNGGNKDKLKILNIHSGTTDDDICNFINNIVIPEAVDIMNKESNDKFKREELGMFFEFTKIWIFLDEINTCKSMELISELICKHSLQGEGLPENIVFIASCNPYRKKVNKINIDEEKNGLHMAQSYKQKKLLYIKEIEDIKNSKNNNLVYNVNPLPHSLLNFIIDFGNLLPQDENDYIKYIIKDIINRIYYEKKNQAYIKEEKDEDENLKNLKELAKNMIIEAQNYIKEFIDKSSASLREIKRFNIFYEFFNNYLNMKKKMLNEIIINEEDKEFYSKLDDYSIQIYSIILSIFICYYLKITDKEKRNILNEKMNTLLKKFDNSFKNKDFLDIPKKEEKFLIDNIKLDNGIIKNKSLIENIFSLFVAINSKVPIFFVGKPEYNKSLIIQQLIKSMQGELSDNPFFKKFPKIMLYKYQFSPLNTPEELKNIFKKINSIYQKLKEYKAYKSIIPLLLFNEMGFVDQSPNNLLKQILSDSEYAQIEGDNPIAFIVISNQIIDLSKLNRGISISFSQTDEEENKDTSLKLCKYLDQISIKYKTFYENLGKIYYEYKKYLKEKHNFDIKEDLLINKDFNHLGKIITKNFKINKDIILEESSISNIEKNFSGIQFDKKEKTSIIVFIDTCRKISTEFKFQKDCNILERIKENLTYIYNFAERNKINYSDYNSSIYKFDTLEEHLGKIILPGVCQFENGKKANIYKLEYYRESRSQIFIEYMLKYVQEPLDYLEKENMVKYIIEEFPDNYDFKKFFNSIQMLVFYLTENESTFDDLYLSDIIEKIPYYLIISEDCKYFFLNKKYKLNKLKINKLLKINDFLEQFCYKDIIKTLNYKYKVNISNEKQKKIGEKLKGNIYVQKYLAAAIRRFISRYLLEIEDINR